MRCRVLLLFGALLIPFTVEALDPPVLIRDGFVEIDVGYLPVPCVMDYNCDGKKDLLVGEAVIAATDYGKVRLYLNQNTDEAPLFSGWSYLQYWTAGGWYDIYLAGSS